MIRLPLLCTLARDIAYCEAVRTLDKAGKIGAVVLTNSNFGEQPLWMREDRRGFSVHMVHYSQNSRPLVYTGDNFESMQPSMRYMECDEHWVWTDGYAQYLRRTGHRGPIHVVGPIMWYVPERPCKKNGDDIRVAVFDVTPAHAERARAMGLINNYYSTENVAAFLEQTIAECRHVGAQTGRVVRILLKHKRLPSTGFHDERYLQLIRRLVEHERGFELVPNDENVYDLIATCDLSICIPFTSVAYVSAHQDRPAIYFDPGAVLASTHEPAAGIYFASGRDKLRRFLTLCLTPERIQHANVLSSD